jgi:flagellar secretion chaperone FliS
VSATDPVQAYRETQIKTANQIKLIVMLYDGAIRHLNLALEDFAGGHERYDRINSHIVAAQDIVSELMASLDFERGGEIARGLFSIYSYANRRLLDGNVRKDRAPLEEVKRLLAELRDAWAGISARKGLAEHAVPSGGVNIAR